MQFVKGLDWLFGARAVTNLSLPWGKKTKMLQKKALWTNQQKVISVCFAMPDPQRLKFRRDALISKLPHILVVGKLLLFQLITWAMIWFAAFNSACFFFSLFFFFLQGLCLLTLSSDTMGTKLAITCAEWTYKSSQHSSDWTTNSIIWEAKGFQCTHTKDRNSLRLDKRLK